MKKSLIIISASLFMALITPLDSIVNAVQDRYSVYPVSLLLHDKYDSASRAKKINAKIFVVMAQNDKVVKAERTQKLIEAFDTSKLKVTVIKNRSHNDISLDKKYYKIMQDFIAEG